MDCAGRAGNVVFETRSNGRKHQSVCLGATISELGGSPKVVHNTPVVSFFNFGEREGSRRRRSWTEGREEDRAARFRILQKTASEAEEP
jgi:hypothetical protein